MKNKTAAPENEAPDPTQPAAEPSTSTADQASPALTGHFAVEGTVPGRVVTTTHGVVDLRTISLELAQELYAAGNFRYLKPTGKTA